MRTVEYELIVKDGTIETRQIGCTIICNDIVIDGQVQVANSTGGKWGSIIGVITNQNDLMNEFADRDQAIEDEAEARANADEALDTAKADKVSLATDGDFASLDEEGNLEDSGLAVSAVTGHMSNKSNPHEVTKSQVGLGNVNNTADLDKPVSTATATELGKKADKVTSATDGNIVQFDENGNIEDSTISSSSVNSHMSNTSNPHSVTATQVGLGNVNNTADLDKPISTATQTALNAKADKVTTATDQNLVQFDENGNIEDSGIGASRITTIEGKIPTQASDLNQLADKAFVNSSISTATATFDGTYNLVTDLSLTTSATQADIALALSNAVVGADNNDYVFVQIPTSDLTPTEISRVDRYKYSSNAWAFEYSLNNSGFTSAQWSALNSGITSAREGSYQTHINDGTIHVTTSNKSAWDAKYDKPSGGIPSTDMASAVVTSLGKADSAIQPDDLKELATVGKTSGAWNAPAYDKDRLIAYPKDFHVTYDNLLLKAKDDIEPPFSTTPDMTKWNVITLWYISENSGNDVHLSVQQIDNDYELCMTYVVEDYDPTKADGYEVGDQCYHNELVDGVLTDVHKCCIRDTSQPAGTYNPLDWEDYE